MAGKDYNLSGECLLEVLTSHKGYLLGGLEILSHNLYLYLYVVYYVCWIYIYFLFPLLSQYITYNFLTLSFFLFSGTRVSLYYPFMWLY